MKRIVAILLLSGILLQTGAKLAIVANFFINQDYIAKNLCVNRNKPKSCCKGKCELNKQLQEEDKKENTPTSNQKDKFETLAFAEYQSVFNFLSLTKGLTCNCYYVEPKTENEIHSVFHPPQV